MSREVVIVSAVRTPFGKFGGSLKDFDCYDLGAMVMKGVLEKVNVRKDIIEEIYWGVGDTSSCKDVYTPVVARQSLIKAGLPPEITSCTLDKACVSAMSAVQLGFRAISSGEIDVAMGGGTTTFSQEPLIVRDMRWNGFRMGEVTMEDPLYRLGYKDFNPVAVDAGEVAVEHGITREQQDEWALKSHQFYGKAFESHQFKEEIMPVEIPAEKGESSWWLAKDEQYRPNISLEKLAKLPTVYESPTITAGNAPGLNDGACAMLIMSKEKADELGLTPLATIVSMANAASKPRLIPEVPAYAIQKALDKSSLSLDQMDLIEINEAFAAMPLVSTKILGTDANMDISLLRDKVNVNGGAIAIGHPNTASGARIIMTLAHELRRRGGGYGVAAICGGLAQGDATIIKVD